MVQHQYPDPDALGAWALLLWRMLQHLRVGQEFCPVFVTDEEFHGAVRCQFVASVGLHPLPLRPDAFRRFVARRIRVYDAIQDAARKAVHYLRDYYQAEFTFSPFRLIPQDANEPGRLTTSFSTVGLDPYISETADHLLELDLLYSRAIRERDQLHLQLHHAWDDIRDLQEEIEQLAPQEVPMEEESVDGPSGVFDPPPPPQPMVVDSDHDEPMEPEPEDEPEEEDPEEIEFEEEFLPVPPGFAPL